MSKIQDLYNAGLITEAELKTRNACRAGNILNLDGKLTEEDIERTVAFILHLWPEPKWRTLLDD